MNTDTPPTVADTEAIRQRTESATEGPWELVPTNTLYMDGKQAYGIRVAGRPGLKVNLTCFPADAEFIAASRADVPSLLAELVDLRERLSALAAFEEHNGESCENASHNIRNVLDGSYDPRPEADRSGLDWRGDHG